MPQGFSFLQSGDYILKAEEALAREPLLSKEDPASLKDPDRDSKDRAFLNALEALTWAVIALAKKK